MPITHFYIKLTKIKQRTLARMVFQKAGPQFQKRWKYPSRLQAYYQENNSDPHNLIEFFNLKIKQL